MQRAPVFVPGRLSPRWLEALRRIVALLLAIGGGVTVRGRGNLPATGGFVLAANHTSRFDPPVVFTALPGRRWVIMAADKYYPKLFFRWIIECVDCLWVRRGETSHQTVQAAIQALRRGATLGLSPEGTRSKTGTLQAGKTGTAFMALTAGVPVVPVAITGTERLASALKRLRRVHMTVTFGSPFTIQAPATGEPVSRKRLLEDGTTEIMCRIAAMLPPEQRGVYAEHPRVSELLAKMRETGGSLS